MIIYEFAFVGLILIVVLVAIGVCGRPLAEGYAEKMKLGTREPSSEDAVKLESRLKSIESRLDEINYNLLQLSESINFVNELKSGSDKRFDQFDEKDAESGISIKIPAKE